jgi:hypothetical protein
MFSTGITAANDTREKTTLIILNRMFNNANPQ